MSEQSSESAESSASSEHPHDVTDEELPEDLRPSEDNPLAEPAGDDVPDDILKETHEESGSRQDESAD
jgi:hypothetical protein